MMTADRETISPSRPSSMFLQQQAAWLAPARAGLLRRAAIAQRRTVLDLGAGIGAVTSELARRCGGRVYALDLSHESLCEVPLSTGALRVVGDACRLPLFGKSVQLIFSQFTLLWVNNLSAAVGEVWRVLEPGGHFCAIEPDYGGLIEYPPAVSVADIWRSALSRAGANVDVGRQLPSLLQGQGFSLGVRLLDQLLPPSSLRFDMLRELPLERDEKAAVSGVEEEASRLSGWQQVAHLPLFLINAAKPE